MEKNLAVLMVALLAEWSVVKWDCLMAVDWVQRSVGKKESEMADHKVERMVAKLGLWKVEMKVFRRE